jgi:hypothetical protein
MARRRVVHFQWPSKFRQMVGKSVWEVFPDGQSSVFERQLGSALKDHVAIKFEFLYPGDQHRYEIQGYPSHPGVILVFRDITGRERASQP